jgi:hypothetical protein
VDEIDDADVEVSEAVDEVRCKEDASEEPVDSLEFFSDLLKL